MSIKIKQPVPRTPEEPTPSDILEEMEPCTPYTAADFLDHHDISRWTIRRRLETLHEEGLIRRKKHSNNVLTYWIYPENNVGETSGGDANE